MFDAIDTTHEVVLFYLGISIIPQFLYFEISFLIRNKNSRPQLYESVFVGFILGVATVAFWFVYGENRGEAGFGLIAFSPAIIGFFIITGLFVGYIYKWRKKSFFYLFKRVKEKKINEL